MIKFRTIYKLGNPTIYGFWQDMSGEAFRHLTLENIISLLDFNQYQYLVNEEVKDKLTKTFKDALEQQMMWERLSAEI